MRNVAGHEDTAFIYDAEHHALGVLPNARRRNVRAFLRGLDNVVPVANATVIWFVALGVGGCVVGEIAPSATSR